MKKSNQKFLSLDKSFRFQIILSCSALIHLTFMLMFAFMKLKPLMNFNMFSVILYVTGAIDCILGKEEKHRYFWTIATFSEIVIHAMLCTLTLGFETLFILYLVITIPLVGYSLFFYFDRTQFRKLTTAFSIATSAVIVFCLVVGNIFGAINDFFGMKKIDETELCVIRTVNVVFSAGMLSGFTFLFYKEIIKLIDKLNESNRKYEYFATHDELTGLANRHSLWKFFSRLMKSGDHFCVVMGDIDDFKKINDTYGHDCGDRVLKSVADIILKNTSDAEMACRWGGEEMLLILRGDKNDCISCIEIVRKQICSLDIEDDGRKVKVSMTFGVADCAELDADALDAERSSHANMDKIISLADKRLYVGKNSGKNIIISE